MMSDLHMPPREWTFGQRSQFALSIALSPDPDGGQAATIANTLSWGSFEIWVNGLNLCKHQDQGVTLDSVSWYLYPLFDWLVQSWDFLLHEERLPNRNDDRDAWLAMHRRADAPPAMDETASEQWDANWSEWWRRHCLLAARDGGLFPRVFIRRFRDTIEFSWGPGPIAGQPEHYFFHASHGYARIDTKLVDQCLCDILDSVTSYLAREAPEVDEFQELKRAYKKIVDGQRSRQRLAIACGFVDQGRADEDRFVELARPFEKEEIDARWYTFIEGNYSSSMVERLPPVALMFGCLSPTIKLDDVKTITHEIVNACRDGMESPKMQKHILEKPIRSTLQQPWDEGYELAETLHESLEIQVINDGSVDIESLYSYLGVRVSEIDLSDKTIRAVSMAGEHMTPTVAINMAYASQEAHVKRFTFGHELCHLLHDRSYGTDLVIASGPWAPVDLEKRANAFAAMFLMPAELIEELSVSRQQNFEQARDVWSTANQLRVGYSALVEHLYNLSFISELTRDRLRIEGSDHYVPPPEVEQSPIQIREQLDP